MPEKAYGTAEWYRQLSRSARNFALVADLTVALLGGGLKIKQKLTGRLADALSELYLLSCVLKRYEDDGKPAADRQIVALRGANGLYRFQEALRGTIDNFPVAPGAHADARRSCSRSAATTIRPPIASATRSCGSRIEPGEVRDRLTRYIFVSKDLERSDRPARGDAREGDRGRGGREEARARHPRRHRPRYHGIDWIGDAVAKGVITEGEGNAAARGRGADRARHRRRPLRSGRSAGRTT